MAAYTRGPKTLTDRDGWNLLLVGSGCGMLAGFLLAIALSNLLGWYS